ncbi:hypothetical protein [Persicirhabdus sediminis]|uniref:Uncharacterized protein n=1 Tax=Persicirhabdus sediminis TaxID=454144 RepID=A0A8J7SJ35_9BACT|nr:hypothetical protein [Persicirhabdus sediminis]MBK1791069.1 hypothetical protein [Persicirhabdus sediminis]
MNTQTSHEGAVTITPAEGYAEEASSYQLGNNPILNTKKILLFILIATIISGSFWSVSPGILCTTLIFCALIFSWLIEFSKTTTIANRQIFSSITSIELNEQNITVQSLHRTSHYQWDAINQLQENEQFYRLSGPNHLTIIIPKSTHDDGLQKLIKTKFPAPPLPLSNRAEKQLIKLSGKMKAVPVAVGVLILVAAVMMNTADGPAFSSTSSSKKYDQEFLPIYQTLDAYFKENDSQPLHSLFTTELQQEISKRQLTKASQALSQSAGKFRGLGKEISASSHSSFSTDGSEKKSTRLIELKSEKRSSYLQLELIRSSSSESWQVCNLAIIDLPVTSKWSKYDSSRGLFEDIVKNRTSNEAAK